MTCWHREICCSYLVGLTMETARKEHPKVRKLQGDQLKMAVVFWYLGKKATFLVYACVVAYTGQVTFYKVQETEGKELSLCYC